MEKPFKTITFLVVVIIYFTSCQSVLSQNDHSVKWVVNSSGASWDYLSEVVMDSSGNYYAAGNYSGTIQLSNFEKGIEGQNDIFLIKYSSDGEVIWLKTIKSKSNCSVSGLSIDTEGYLYVAGYFMNDLTIDEVTTISDDNNIFVLKLTNSGRFEWIKSFQGDFRSDPLIVKTDLQNNVFVAGSFNNFLTLDSVTYKGNYYSDIFLLSFNNEGNSLGSFHFVGEGNDYVSDIAIKDHFVYAVGSFEYNITLFDTTLVSCGQTDAFFIRFSLDSDQSLIRQIGSKFKDFGTSISLDNNDDIIIGGAHSGNIKLSHDITLQSVGSLDTYVCKYNKNGSLIWADNLGGFANDYLTDLTLNENQDIYLIGTYRGIIKKKDAEIESNRFSHDIYFAKYDRDGNFQYLQSIGDTTPELSSTLINRDIANIVISSNLYNTVNILENKLDSVAGNDFLIADLFDCSFGSLIELPRDTSLCGNDYTIIADTNFVNYYWNTFEGDNSYKADSSGLYILTVHDINGCISSDSIDIILNKPIQVYLGDDIISNIGDTITLSTNANYKSYLWNTQSKTKYLKIITNNMLEGEYFYKVTIADSNNCHSTDEIMLTLVNSLEQNSDGLKLVVYPNPTRDYLNFSISNIDVSKDVNLSLITQLGISVWINKIIPSNESYMSSLDVSPLNPGTYVFHVTNGSNSVNQIITILQ